MMNMDAAAFSRWYRTAKKGERLVYFLGNLAASREKIRLLDGKYERIPNRKVAALADKAMQYQQQGKVMLFQQRTRLGNLRYIAVKRVE